MKNQSKQKIAALKLKILSIARFNLMLKKSKEASESHARRKSSIFDAKIPIQDLLKADEEIVSPVNKFLTLKQIDS